MHLPRLVFNLLILLFPAYVLADPSYFIINQPSKGTQWVNNQTNYASWTQGRDQGILTFDVELIRMSMSGALLVALNVPSYASSLPIALQDVPAGDDYYLTFINSTHGLMIAMSTRFTILPADQTPNDTSPSPGKQLLATVTMSGAPNPTANFAYTFPAMSSARKAWSVCGTGAALIGVVVSFWTVW